MQREDPLDPVATTHSSDGKSGAHAGAMLLRDHDTLEHLDTFLVPFRNLLMDTDRIARPKFRQILLEVFGFNRPQECVHGSASITIERLGDRRERVARALPSR